MRVGGLLLADWLILPIFRKKNVRAAKSFLVAVDSTNSEIVFAVEYCHFFKTRCFEHT